jgi:phospho-N-acetylmuramoyl-pentapeptide-transferase
MLSQDNFRIYTATVLLSFIVAYLVLKPLIPYFRKLKFGNTEREELESHQKKNGTPSMGGVGILIGTLFAITGAFILEDLFGHATEGLRGVTPVVVVMLCFGLIGFMDDYLKSVKHKSDGLIAWEKMLLEIFVTGVFMAYIILTHDGDAFITNVYVPFVDCTIKLGVLGYPIFFLAVIGTVNGVNFTDGVDGLVSTVTLPVCAFFVVAGEVTGIYGTSMVAASVMGALFGFLMHNAHPAKIFMGDTGSLALGGFVASAAYMTGTPIFILIVGFVYWLEIISVMLQVSYFKITKGKRIFRMAPIHHHFELGGWSETKVVTVFASITAALCAIGICGL